MFLGGKRTPMPDCNADLLAYHDWAIKWSSARLRDMRLRRDRVRALIKRRLRANNLYQPLRFRGQGSVAMGTIIREQYYSDYDLDDGIYFSAQALTGPRGGAMSAREARDMVLEAAYHEGYEQPPEMLKNCIRVYYAQGFHIDLPVYRETARGFQPPLVELASSDWRTSDPQAVTAWFRAANAASPGLFGPHQLARIVHYIKAWSCSRSAWIGYNLRGFGITKLVVDHYKRRIGRDDRSLYDTLNAIHDQLKQSTAIAHPILEGEFIINPAKDARARHFRACLEEQLERLQPLTTVRNRQDALRLWDSFFNTDYFRKVRSRLI